MKKRFVPKRYGRGFVPVSVQGWLFTLLLLVIVFASAYHHGLLTDTIVSWRSIAGYAVDVYLVIFASSWFMEKYTDGELKWRWGHDHGKKND